MPRCAFSHSYVSVFDKLITGWQEISALMQLFDETHPFNNKDKYLLRTLHSGVSSKLQNLVFEKPQKGVRKIILSTNIAETSVTINDVAFVIDSGRAKEKSYDPHSNTSTLQPVWISQASAKQRRGRAGRTQPGLCFHLFSRGQHDSFREYLESELLRTSLEEICLQIKKLDLAPGGAKDPNGVPAFLSAAMVPPSKKSITAALDSLIALGAMDKKTNLTPLGHCLSLLSVDPKHGKMIIWAYVLGCSKVRDRYDVIQTDYIYLLYIYSTNFKPMICRLEIGCCCYGSWNES